MFTNGRITRLQAGTDGNDAGARDLELRELGTIERLPTGSTSRHSTCADDMGGKSNKDGSEHRQAASGKRSRDSGAPGEGQANRRDEGDAKKKMKIEDATGREHTTPLIAIPKIPEDPRALGAAGHLCRTSRSPSSKSRAWREASAHARRPGLLTQRQSKPLTVQGLLLT